MIQLLPTVARLSIGSMMALMIVGSVFAEAPYSGGKTTTQQRGANAYSQAAPNLPLSKQLDFSVGNSFFRNPWVPAPSSTDARDGLGPLFNTNGCENCHLKDGRGHAPSNQTDLAVSMLIRMSIPVESEEERRLYAKLGVNPEPTYGTQLQDFALPNQMPEGRVEVNYQPVTVTFEDGATVELRKPSVTIADLNYGPLHPNTMISARIAPAMIGLGLLENISEETILSFADPDDLDGDGISGRPNRVYNVETEQQELGRFGWKAGQPTLMQQNAAAFSNDIGLTSRLFPAANCSSKQEICAEQPNGGEHEVSDNILNFVEFYSQHLAVPARRNMSNEEVARGETIFNEIGCAGCHKSNIRTAENAELPALSQQLIDPYTDLLLHDMGPDLADNRPEALANGREWRTAPLWGIGYSKEVSSEANFLHDGRARTPFEAVLWHGGEADLVKQRVLKLSRNEREALKAFINSL
ncbi:di-heme oxidoreductase family protein [Vibrio sp. RC27]